MKKNKELFFFFAIEEVAAFKAKLGSDIHALITSTSQILSVSTQPITAVNLAFSQTGLLTLGFSDLSSHASFASGQFADAATLSDSSTTNWVSGFAGTSIHGVFLLASDTVAHVNDELSTIQSILGSSIKEIYRLQGEARPGSEQGHEHFGFMDGISQPGVIGFTGGVSTVKTVPGQILLPSSEFLLSDNTSWTKDGSFLAFRQLKQLVPEFNKYLVDHPINETGVLTPEQGSALLGARMMGRWKSGAPVDLAPLFDDPVLAADPQRNNNFTFAHTGETLATNQTRCPFSAHIRKTRPRADFSPENTANHIIRAGIPYGPEVTSIEAASNLSNSSNERGLAFVAYQSDLDQGFRFLQQFWANNPSFLRGTGVDPIIGALQGAERDVTGLDPTDPAEVTKLTKDFIVSRGGEYFFSPSLDAIQNTLSV